jgi:hypothetical protein
MPWIAKDVGGFKSIRVMHQELVAETLQLVDVTWRHNYDQQAPERSTIEARVSSLSPFTLAFVKRPALEAIDAPTDPVLPGALITASVAFTDPDGASDVHTATWTWGDGTTSAGTVVEPTSGGFGHVTGTHAYAAPGVYTIIVRVDDNTAAGGIGTAAFPYLAVAAPGTASVTGGGTISSPAGAYRPDGAVAGQASFGLVAQYDKGAAVPKGATEFNLPAASFHFKSRSYDWLVTANAKAHYKGRGTVNGSGDYGFSLVAIDGDRNAKGAADGFRLTIWEIGTGWIVYDNAPAAADPPDARAIAGGSIVIHSNGR